jgi:6-phosphofructokinase
MKNKSKAVKRIAVLCGGGPAPGLNAVICSIVIEAIRWHDSIGYL